MSVNSSSSSNATFPPSNSSSSDSLYSLMQRCTFSTVGIFNVTCFLIVSILLLLPLCILVLYLGLQQRRQRCSRTTMSHSDVFTYHMVVAELMGISGSTLICFGVRANLLLMMTLGSFLSSINLNGQFLFHILTCVERYLAVVHPITYLSLKKTKATRIRNIIIGCVWLLCYALFALLYIEDRETIHIISYFNLSFFLILICFCSFSILRVLIRPGPGDGDRGGDKQRVDQSKLRAFYTIVAILGVLMFRLGGNVLVTALYDSQHLTATERCSLWLSLNWFSLPSSLVLPLLYLQRAGKLVCCKNNKTSGKGSE